MEGASDGLRGAPVASASGPLGARVLVATSAPERMNAKSKSAVGSVGSSGGGEGEVFTIDGPFTVAEAVPAGGVVRGDEGVCFDPFIATDLESSKVEGREPEPETDCWVTVALRSRRANGLLRACTDEDIRKGFVPGGKIPGGGLGIWDVGAVSCDVNEFVFATAVPSGEDGELHGGTQVESIPALDMNEGRGFIARLDRDLGLVLTSRPE